MVKIKVHTLCLEYCDKQAMPNIYALIGYG